MGLVVNCVTLSRSARVVGEAQSTGSEMPFPWVVSRPKGACSHSAHAGVAAPARVGRGVLHLVETCPRQRHARDHRRRVLPSDGRSREHHGAQRRRHPASVNPDDWNICGSVTASAAVAARPNASAVGRARGRPGAGLSDPAATRAAPFARFCQPRARVVPS